MMRKQAVFNENPMEVAVNILICDDMKEDSENLAGLLRDLGYSPVVFHNGRDALDYVCTGSLVDCCFLDIIMAEMNGIVLADMLRGDGFSGEIVFLSASNDFAYESYKVSAFSYLIKPPSRESVESVLDKIISARREADRNGIFVNTRAITRFIKFHELSHIEVIQHNVYFRLNGGDEVSGYATLQEIAPQLLSDGRFVQCHRSFIVNMEDIEFIADREITMRSGAKIPISRSFPDTRSAYFKWMFGGKRK